VKHLKPAKRLKTALAALVVVFVLALAAHAIRLICNFWALLVIFYLIALGGGL
jgi:hypothetical protein